jgi:acetyl esterase/lipase
MPLDPQCQALVTALEAMKLPALADMTPEECRATVRGFTTLMGEPEEVANVEDREVPGPAGPIPVRIITPAAPGPGPLPAVLYFHGGGFVFGDSELIDPIIRTLANKSGAVVVSVDYRLSPEDRYPVAGEDAYAALTWVVDNGSEIGVDPTRVAVSGDSAGGNLSAVVCLMAKDRGGPPVAFQVLIYPVTDHTMDRPSHQENAEGPILTLRDMRYFWDQYMPTGDRSVPYASPLRATDLSGLPPALVVTAEFDPLRDEGEAYAQRLSEAGVPTEVRRYDGMFHGFFWMPAAIDRGRDAMDDIAEALRKALG